MRRAFSPARPSSSGPALRGEDTWGPFGTFPGALTADPCAGPCAQEGASAPGGGGTHAILRLLAAQPAMMEVRAGPATWFGCRRWASWCYRTVENSYLAAPSPQVEKLSGCEGGSGTVGAMPGGSWSLALQCPAKPGRPQTSCGLSADLTVLCGRVPSGLLPYLLLISPRPDRAVTESGPSGRMNEMKPKIRGNQRDMNENFLFFSVTGFC